MKYEIHFTLPDGTQDSVVIEGNSVHEIRTIARDVVADRSGSNAWSKRKE